MTKQMERSEAKNRLYRIFIYVILSLLALMVIIPVAWVFMASIKANSEFYGNAWALPSSFCWQNFVDAWNKAKMGQYFLNSVLSTGLGLIILLAVSIPCAYVLSRMEFRGRRLLNGFMKAGLFINLSYIVIPIFLMLRSWDTALKTALGLRRFEFFLNNIWMLALIYASTALPFTIYLLSNYFRSIAKTYEEAAYIDGAGYFKTMMRIIVPMAKPSIVTVILFNFLAFWNEYILALTLLPGRDFKTLPVGLINLMQSQRGAANYGPLYAGLVMVMLPTLILYMLVQRKLTEGMMVGGDKG